MQYQVCLEHNIITSIPALRFCMIGGEEYQTVTMTEAEYYAFVAEGEQRWGGGFNEAPANFNQLTGEVLNALPRIEF